MRLTIDDLEWADGEVMFISVKDGKTTSATRRIPLAPTVRPLVSRLAHNKAYQEAVEARSPAWSDQKLLETVNADRLDYEPGGTQWAYSSAAYLMIRQLIERTIGQDIKSALAELIIRPLELSSATIAREQSDWQNCRWLENSTYDPKWAYHGVAVSTPQNAIRFLNEVLVGSFLGSEPRAGLSATRE